MGDIASTPNKAALFPLLIGARADDAYGLPRR